MLPAIETAHLFPILNARLIDLLRSLDAGEWETPTVAGVWTVKDVATHLLDTQERLLERLRGRAQSPPPLIRSNADLVAFINRVNAEGVSRYRRLAPSELCRGPLFSGSAWSLVAQPPDPPASETTIAQEIAWRIFTKGIGRAEAEREVRVSGDADLGRHVLGALAIVG